jgi:hypothetical protein
LAYAAKVHFAWQAQHLEHVMIVFVWPAQHFQQLQALTGAFTESLKSTIAAQETQLATQFAELKDMIKRRTGSAKTGTSPPQKKSKTGDGDESL